MSANVEGRIKSYLVNELHYPVEDCGTILECMRRQARVAGHELDERFAAAGLGAGPEALAAARIVDRALCGGGTGSETPEFAIKKQVDAWIRNNPRKSG
jgi:hypothetical protein